MVSVASTSWQWRENSKSQAFRDWLDSDPAVESFEVIKLPGGSFKESGTMINTIAIKIRRDGEPGETQSTPAVEEPARELTFAEKFRLTKAS